MVRAGSEIERTRIGSRSAAKDQRPEAIDNDRIVEGIPELPLELAVARKGVDSSVAKVADEQVGAEAAEDERSLRNTPRRS